MHQRRCPQRPEASGILELETDSGELPEVGAGNRTGVLQKRSKCSQPQSHLSSPYKLLFNFTRNFLSIRRVGSPFLITADFYTSFNQFFNVWLLPFSGIPRADLCSPLLAFAFVPHGTLFGSPLIMCAS